jgi:hypothetical protein
MLIVEFPAALVEMIGDFVRLWWRELMAMRDLWRLSAPTE